MHPGKPWWQRHWLAANSCSGSAGVAGILTILGWEEEGRSIAKVEIPPLVLTNKLIGFVYTQAHRPVNNFLLFESFLSYNRALALEGGLVLNCLDGGESLGVARETNTAHVR